MKLFHAIAFVATAACAVSAFAQAPSDYRASLTMTQGLPALRSGSVSLDGPHNIDGDWGGNIPHASTSVRHQTGLVADMVTGDLHATWSERSGNQDMHRSGGIPTGMSEAHAWSYEAADPAGGSSAHVHYNGLTTSGNMWQPGTEINSWASWDRSFTLNAFTSFTFSSLASISIGGDASPLDRLTWIESDLSRSFASIVMADAAGRVGASISAVIDSAFTGNIGSVFSYGIGRDGLLSLTVTNNTSSAMRGSVGADTWVTVSSPVPEPEAMLLMAAGLALVGVRARRRAAGSALAA